MEESININKCKFIPMSRDSLTDYYKIIRVLGEGGFGKVYEVQSHKSKEYFACKKLSKNNLIDLEKFKKEICIISNADHPNIIKLYEVYESNRSLYLIMELCRGGPLFKKISEKVHEKNMYTEKDASVIFHQIMSGIEYCHNHGICHRDLKPENILYLNDDIEKDNSLKIINFIFSKHFKIHKLSSRIGTSYYAAPEVFKNNYTEKCDIWSAGVLLYFLLSGHLPFNGGNETEIMAKINSYKLEMNNDLWKNISNEAKDLIQHMLIQENERFSAKEVLAHPWFKIVNNIKNQKINIDFDVFKKYTEENTFKKIILNYIATRLNEKEIDDLKILFQKFDENSDGQIEYEEFEKGFLEYKNKDKLFNQIDIKKIFNLIDSNKNGKIDYSEFIEASIIGRKEIIEKRLLDAFSSFDKHQTGKIKKEDFITALHIDESVVKQGFEKTVENLRDDDLIDYNEFLKILNK